MREKLYHIFIILLVTSALFILSEITLRVIFPEKNLQQSPPAPKDLAYQFNDDYLVSLKPNVQKTYIEREESIVKEIIWKTNKDSFMGEELEENPDVRIIVYGDSNIQARFLNIQDTFPARLGKYLEEHLDKNIEVLNAGLIGFGPDQSLIRFSKEVDIYKPDIVVFHVFADNDFGDIVRNRLYELDADGNLAATSHEKKPDERLMEASEQKNPTAALFSSLLIVRAAQTIHDRIWPQKHTETEHDDLISLYTSLLDAEYKVYKENKPRYFSHFADHYDLDVAVSPDSESAKVKVRLMEAVLKEAKRMAESKGVEFLVLIQPSVIDLTNNFLISYKDLQKFPGYQKTNLTDAVDNICKANNINRINLFNVFQKNNPGGLFFTGGNNHWNGKGQDIAAREVRRVILEKELLRNINITR